MIHILIIGPPASGKFTIGKELALKLDTNYIHEHNMLDIITQFEIKDTYNNILEYLYLRLYILKRYFKEKNKDLVSTMVFDFNNKLHYWFIENIVKLLHNKDDKLIIIELIANQTLRINRNTNDDRLFYKPTKQDIEKSTKKIYELDKMTSLNSTKSEFCFSEQIEHIKVKNETSVISCVDIIITAINSIEK